MLRCFLIVSVSSTLLVADPLSRGSLIEEQSDTVARQIRPTYWKEGGIVGALATGAFLGWLVHGFCSYSESGGGFPKHPNRAPPEPS